MSDPSPSCDDAHRVQQAGGARLDDVDRRIVIETQAGLPLVPRPYHAIAARLDIDPVDLMARLRRMLATGIIRRIGAVPNHYALGYRANGMSVWDVPDEHIREIGTAVGELAFVSHCYHRPRRVPDWPYNLFAMVHGRDREEVAEHVAEVVRVIGVHNRAHTVLYSTRILKKTGLRLADAPLRG